MRTRPVEPGLDAGFLGTVCGKVEGSREALCHIRCAAKTKVKQLATGNWQLATAPRTCIFRQLCDKSDLVTLLGLLAGCSFVRSLAFWVSMRVNCQRRHLCPYKTGPQSELN